MNLGTLISKITNGRRERLTSPVPHRRRIDYRKLRVLERSFASHRYSIIWSARASTVGGTKRLARKESRNGYYGTSTWDQSALMPTDLITLAHFSVSSAMSLPKSAGETTSGVTPKTASRAFILGSARPALISLLSLSTISAGVFLG